MNDTQRKQLIESVDAIEIAGEELETILAHDGYRELLGDLLGMVRNAITNADELRNASDKDIEDVIDGILQDGHVGILHQAIREAQKELTFASQTITRVQEELDDEQWFASMDAALQVAQSAIHA